LADAFNPRNYLQHIIVASIHNQAHFERILNLEISKAVDRNKTHLMIIQNISNNR